jgi:hypothetical protein
LHRNWQKLLSMTLEQLDASTLQSSTKRGRHGCSFKHPENFREAWQPATLTSQVATAVPM